MPRVRLRYERLDTQYYRVTRQDTGTIVGELFRVDHGELDEPPFWQVELVKGYQAFPTERDARRYLQDLVDLAAALAR